MTTLIAAIFAAVLAVPAGAFEPGPAMQQAGAWSTEAAGGVGASRHETASLSAGQIPDGRGLNGAGLVVDAPGRISRTGMPLRAANFDSAQPESEPPVPSGKVKKESWWNPDGWPAWLQYGASAGVGAAQGFLTVGLTGALAGAGIGFAAAILLRKGHTGAALGMMAGSAVGMAMGGPLGSVIGAVLGGLLGHFIGKFL